MNSIQAMWSVIAAAAATLFGMQNSAGAADARSNSVTMKGKPLTLQGHELKVGDVAPQFAAVANDLSDFKFDAKSGQVWVIASVPSLDTPVCSIETRRFNQEATQLGGSVKVLTISMDLPFAQKRWCGAEGVQNLQTISDYRDRAFGKEYGVYIKEVGLLARAVFVVGKDGKIAYKQIVPEVTSEPDYAAALNAAKQAAK